MGPHDDRRLRAPHASLCALGWLIAWTATLGIALSAPAQAQYGESLAPFDTFRSFAISSPNPRLGFPEESLLAMGDIDRDQRPDFAILNPLNVQMLSLRGDGTLRRQSILNTSWISYRIPRQVHLHDIDLDGALDSCVLFASMSPSNPLVYQELVCWTTPPSGSPMSSSTTYYGLQRIGGHSKLLSPRIDPSGRRILVHAYGLNTIDWLYYQSTSPGTLNLTGPRYIVGVDWTVDYRCVGIGDFDGDDIDEVVIERSTRMPGVERNVYDEVAIHGYDPATLMHSRIVAIFRRPTTPGASRVPVTVADLDGDGRDELIAIIEDAPSSGSLRQYFTTVARQAPAAATFEWSPLHPLIPPDPSLSDLRRPVQAGDVDQDGILDLIVTWTRERSLTFASSAPQRPYLHVGLGNDFFHRGSPLLPPTSGSDRIEVIGDLDGDGDLDLLVQRWTDPMNPTGFAFRNRARDADPDLQATLFDGVTSSGAALIPQIDVRITLTGATPGSPAILGLGLTRQSTFAADGRILDPSDLLIDPLYFGLRMTDALGDAAIAVPVPNDPALIGTSITAQWLVQGQNGWRGSAPAMLFLR